MMNEQFIEEQAPQESAIATQQRSVTPTRIIFNLVDARMKQIASIIPAGIDIERLKYVTLQALEKNPDLLKCDPKSVVSAMVQAFEVGLEPNTPKKEAYLIPYGKDCKFEPSYIGLITLARRSGMVRSVKARIVHQADDFRVIQGSREELLHVPVFEDHGPMIAAYSLVDLEGQIDFEVMTKAEVDQVKKASKASSSGPWVTWYEEMAKKAVIRRHYKRLPKDNALARAMEIDEQNHVIVVDPASTATQTRAAELRANLTKAKEPEVAA